MDPVRRLDLRLPVDAQRRSAFRRMGIRPDDNPVPHTHPRTFPMNGGSRDCLKVSARWGFRPNARRMRPIVAGRAPQAAAIEYVLRWVASRGIGPKFIATTRSRSPSPILRGAAGCAPSSRLSHPAATNRRRTHRFGSSRSSAEDSGIARVWWFAFVRHPEEKRRQAGRVMPSPLRLGHVPPLSAHTVSSTPTGPEKRSALSASRISRMRLGTNRAVFRETPVSRCRFTDAMPP